MPLPFKLTKEQVVIVWGFASPFLKARAAASQPLWDDRLVNLADLLFSNPIVVENFVRVINREAAPETFQLQAPAELKMECRAFAGNLEFVEGWLRDFSFGVNSAPYVSAAEGYSMEVMPAYEAKGLTAQQDRQRGGAYVADVSQQPLPLAQPYVDPRLGGGEPGGAAPHPAEQAAADNISAQAVAAAAAMEVPAIPDPAPNGTPTIQAQQVSAGMVAGFTPEGQPIQHSEQRATVPFNPVSPMHVTPEVALSAQSPSPAIPLSPEAAQAQAAVQSGQGQTNSAPAEIASGTVPSSTTEAGEVPKHDTPHVESVVK